MREDAASLVKRFEDTFFESIYTMRGWTWNYTHKHPSVVGKWINDLVYERIAPVVLSELRKKNPITDTGHRKHKHHQFLTEEIGIPKLLNHIASLEALSRASNYNWDRFMDMVDIAFPKQHQQLKIYFDDIYDETKKDKYDTIVKDNNDIEINKPSTFNKSLKQALDFNPNKDKK